MKKRGNRDKYAIAGLFIVPILLLALFFFNHQEELAFLSSAKSYLTGAVVSDGSGELPSGIIRVLDAEANSTSCGYVNTNITLTAGIVNSTGTCFTINISNLVLDCAGSTILYGQDVFGWGVNNTGFNNITVKNCLIFTGSAIDTSNYGLYFTNGVNSTIRNNSIKTNGSGSSDYGIYLLKYNYTTMELNTIQTNGTSSNHGIYLSDGLNSTLRNNTITTNGTSSSNYGMYLLRYNDSLIANSTISSYSSGGYGVYLSASGTNTLRSNNITTRTSILNSQSRGILIDGKNSFNLIINNTILADCQNCHTIAISGGNNNTVRENTILTAQSNGNDHGIDITGGSKHVVDGNTMNIGGSDTGMYLAASTSLEVRNNLFPLISTVYNDFGIRLVATNDSTFNNNTFASESRWGFTFDSNSSNNTFSSNAILLNDSTGENYGFWLNQGSNNLFINNNITVGSQGTTIDTSGFRLDGTSKDNIFINNIVSLSSSHVSIYDTTANVQNALIYNNSFGQINWTLSNLTTNITLNVGNTIYLQNNIVGLTDNANSLYLDGQARIEIKSLNHATTPTLLKDGIRCDNNTALCNMTYDSSAGILYANVSSFSNYSSSISCGYLNSDTTMNQNVNSTGTCFVINASSITLDCVGYNITFGTNSGSWVMGVNNSAGKTNVTIKNCRIVDGNVTHDSQLTYGILAGIDWVVYNNIVVLENSIPIGIRIDGGSRYNISQNNVSLYLSEGAINPTGLYIQGGDGIIHGNTIYNAISSYPVLLFGNVGNISFKHNRITSTSSNGLQITNIANSTFENNTIVFPGGASTGILFGDNSGFYSIGNLFLNNNVTASSIPDGGGSLVFIDKTNGSGTNTIIYNNSFGQVNWTLTNLSTNVNLRVGNGIVIQQNSVGLLGNATMYLNGSSKIEIRGLSYSSTPTLLKDGTRCDNNIALCNITYDSANGVLYANISSFSNYTTSSVNCSYLNLDTTLGSNVNSPGTCFTINASDLTLDCAGYTVTYGDSSANNSYGIISDGYNNTIIKNCTIKKGSAAGSQNFGIFLNDSSNSSIFNNIIKTNGTEYNYGLSLEGNSENVTIENNTIITQGSSWRNYGVDLSSDYGPPGIQFATISGNTISTNGTSQNLGITIIQNAHNLTIINNTINTNGKSVQNWGISTTAEDTTIKMNVITTNGTSDNTGISITNPTSLRLLIEENSITAGGSGRPNYGIGIDEEEITNVVFINNNITSLSGDNAIFDVSFRTFVTVNNTLIYNNSFGQINWSLTNLTTNITLQLGSTIFIESNKIGLTDSAQALNLDGSARITFYNLTYTTPQLLKDGTACSSPTCNMSYDSTNKIVYTNISSFSNYTTQETPITTTTSSPSSGGSSSNPSPPPAPPSEAAAAPTAPPAAPVSAPPVVAQPTPEAVQSQPISPVVSVPITLTNPTSQEIIIRPTIRPPGSSFPQEIKVEEALKEKYIDLDLSEEEIQEKIQAEIECLKIIEQEKIYSLLGRFSDWSDRILGTSDFVPSPEKISCSLLKPRILNDEEIVLKPGETIQKEFQISHGISTNPQPIKITFTSEDKEFFEQEVTVTNHLIGSAVNLNPKEKTIDVYVLIPEKDQLSQESRLYTYELSINDGDVSVYADEFGIFSIPYNQSIILAQQFSYNSSVYEGEKIISARILEAGKLIANHQFLLNFNTGITSAVTAEVIANLENKATNDLTGEELEETGDKQLDDNIKKNLENTLSVGKAFFAQGLDTALSTASSAGQTSVRTISSISKNYGWIFLAFLALALLITAIYYSIPLFQRLHLANAEKIEAQKKELAKQEAEKIKLEKLRQKEYTEHLSRLDFWKDRAELKLSDELRAVKLMLERVEQEERVVKEAVKHKLTDLFKPKPKLPPAPKPISPQQGISSFEQPMVEENYLETEDISEEVDKEKIGKEKAREKDEEVVQNSEEKKEKVKTKRELEEENLHQELSRIEQELSKL